MKITSDSHSGKGAVGFLVRRGLRRRTGSWALVAMLAAGTVTTGVGALNIAERTITAHPRLLDRVNAADATLGIGSPDDEISGNVIAPEQLERLATIAQISVARSTLGSEVDADGRLNPQNQTGLLVDLDDGAGRRVGGVPLHDGRMPSPDNPDEVAISDGAARRLHVRVGDRIRYAVASFEQVAQIEASGGERGGTIVEPVVVGIFGPQSLNGPEGDPGAESLILASAAFLDAHPHVGTYQVASIRFDGDVTAAQFRRELEKKFGANQDVTTREQLEDSVRRAVQPEAAAVLALGVAALLAGLIITAQALARQLLAADEEELVLMSIGLSRRQRASARWIQASIVLVAGSALGAVGAALASTRGPIGIARAFEPSGGIWIKPWLLVGAALALVAIQIAVAAPLAWRASRLRKASSAPSPSRVTSLLGAAPVSVRAGAALAGRAGGAAAAVRAAILGAATAVVAVLGVTTFGASLHRLTSTPALYGQNFDLAVWDGYGAIEDSRITAVLSDDPDVDGIALAADSGGSVEGREASLIGLDDVGIGPTVTSGRAPSAPDEALIGRRLAGRIGVSAGDTVRVQVAERTVEFRVVGTGVSPGALGDGAVFTIAGLRSVAPDAEVGFQYVRIRDGARTTDVQNRYLRAFDECRVDCDIDPPSPPTDVSYLEGVGSLPGLLAVALAMIGIAMTIHALVIVGRRNRRALAVLRALGSTRRQVMGCMLMQASLILAAAVAVGIPLGLLTGRAVWRLFADELGVVPDPRTPALMSTAFVAILALVTLVAAAGPSAVASRKPVVLGLRADR